MFHSVACLFGQRFFFWVIILTVILIILWMYHPKSVASTECIKAHLFTDVHVCGAGWEVTCCCHCVSCCTYFSYLHSAALSCLFLCLPAFASVLYRLIWKTHSVVLILGVSVSWTVVSVSCIAPLATLSDGCAAFWYVGSLCIHAQISEQVFLANGLERLDLQATAPGPVLPSVVGEPVGSL